MFNELNMNQNLTFLQILRFDSVCFVIKHMDVDISKKARLPIMFFKLLGIDRTNLSSSDKFSSPSKCAVGSSKYSLFPNLPKYRVPFSQIF